MADAVCDISSGCLFQVEVEEVNRARAVKHVDSDVAYLTQVPRFLIEARQLGDGSCVGRADPAW